MTERLEEIKEEYRDAIRVIGIARKDIDYLIQQAELSVGLEHELEAADRQEEQWKELISTTMHWKSIYEKEAQRYKQALEEIKNNSKYDWDIYDAVAIAIRALEREG